jgi:ATP-dependent helicase/nuclease subunit B
MPVTFVIGRAGSGKTTRCFRQIVDAARADQLGPDLLLILPKQQSI